jgi:ABC-type molybdate transport system substrate-binding protein
MGDAAALPFVDRVLLEPEGAAEEIDRRRRILVLQRGDDGRDRLLGNRHVRSFNGRHEISKRLPYVRSMTPLKVLSAGSTVYGLRPCAELFARDTGIPVEVATDHGHNIHRAAQRGEADADLVVLPSDMIASLASAGRADHNSVIAIGAVRIGAAVREGAPRPDVSTMEALRRALVAADAVLLTRAPTGDHLMGVIARLGLADAVAAKLERFETSTLLNRRLAAAAGIAAIGFGPATEIQAWRGRGIAWAGAVPDEIQVVLPYSAAILAGARSAEHARALLSFLATPPARRHFLDSGVE